MHFYELKYDNTPNFMPPLHHGRKMSNPNPRKKIYIINKKISTQELMLWQIKEHN